MNENTLPLQNTSATVYVCSACESALFAASQKFDAGCGFPSFAQHLGTQVTLKPLHTYGRHRIQLLCTACGQHLGHLFPHKHTATKLRYCINAAAIAQRNSNTMETQ